MAKHDKRIRLIVMKNNGSISAASNKSLEMAQSEFIALMDHDDELTKDIFFWIINEINKYPDINFIYSDECKVDCKNNFKYDFNCKPNWPPSFVNLYVYWSFNGI